MPKYQPLDIGVALEASLSDLLTFHWDPGGIVADFILPDRPSHMLRVEFDRQCIVRLLDEMPLSTEDDPAQREGMVAENFAYRVAGAPFPQQQSPTWLEIEAPVSHYLFVTGWACMDVLSRATPSFKVIERPVDAA